MKVDIGDLDAPRKNQYVNYTLARAIVAAVVTIPGVAYVMFDDAGAQVVVNMDETMHDIERTDPGLRGEVYATLCHLGFHYILPDQWNYMFPIPDEGGDLYYKIAWAKTRG